MSPFKEGRGVSSTHRDYPGLPVPVCTHRAGDGESPGDRFVESPRWAQAKTATYNKTRTGEGRPWRNEQPPLALPRQLAVPRLDYNMD